MDTLLATARRGHPGLFWMSIGMAALAAGLLVLAVVDQRELLGAPLWFKPLKFAISFVAYGMALAWMLGRLPTRALQRSGWAIVAGVGDRDGDHRGPGRARRAAATSTSTAASAACCSRSWAPPSG